MNMKERATDAESSQADKVEIAVQLDSELLEQIQKSSIRSNILLTTPAK